MAFYKNCSVKAESVPIGDGNVVAVRPGDVIEVVRETAALRRLLGSRKVVRCATPARPVVKREAPVEPEKPIEPPTFAQRVQDKPADVAVKVVEEPKVAEATQVAVVEVAQAVKKRKRGAKR
jgi:hypothetical protein